MDSDILVVSPGLSNFVPHHRNPLLRLILPLEQVPVELKTPTGRVWWIESRGSKLWLRGFLNVKAVTEEHKLEDNSAKIIWHTSILDSERLTWPGVFAPRSAEITNVAGNWSADDRITVRAIPVDWSQAFCKRCDSLVENAWSYDLACRHYMRLLQSLDLAGQMAIFAGNIEKAWTFARMAFARSELVSLPGYDAYQVAAAAFAGLPEVPPAFDWYDAAKHGLKTEEAMIFEPLDPQNISFTVGAWSQKGSRLDSQVALERSNKRHQQILKSLAESLLTKKLAPSYNRLIDAFVKLPKYDILFEVKSATEGNFAHQIRQAVAQLLEYRFRYKKQNGDKPIRLVAVIEAIDSDAEISFVRDFLGDTGISLVTWKASNNKFEGLDVAIS